MNPNSELSFKELRRKRADEGSASAGPNPASALETDALIGPARSAAARLWPAPWQNSYPRASTGTLSSPPMSLWTGWGSAFRRHRAAILTAGCLSGLVGGVLGLWLWPGERTLSIHVIRQQDLHLASTELPDSRPPSTTLDATLLAQAARSLEPATPTPRTPTVFLPPLAMASAKAETSNSLVLTLTQPANDPEASKRLIEWAEAIRQFARQWSSNEAAQLRDHWQQQLARVEADLRRVGEELQQLRGETQTVDLDFSSQSIRQQLEEIESRLLRLGLDASGSQASSSTGNLRDDRLLAAQQELARLSLEYKDEHPAVQAQRARIRILEHQERNAPPGLVTSSSTNDLSRQQQILEARRAELFSRLERWSIHAARLHELTARQRSLEQSRSLALSRSADAARWAESPLAVWRILQTPARAEVKVQRNWGPPAALAFTFGLAGLMGIALPRLSAERRNPIVETSQQAAAWTGLPVHAALPTVQGLKGPAREKAEFSAWRALRAGLRSITPASAVVGFLPLTDRSRNPSWATLMAPVARRAGFPVLVLRPAPSNDPEAQRVGHRADAATSTRRTSVTASSLLGKALRINTEDSVRGNGPHSAGPGTGGTVRHRSISPQATVSGLAQGLPQTSPDTEPPAEPGAILETNVAPETELLPSPADLARRALASSTPIFLEYRPEHWMRDSPNRSQWETAIATWSAQPDLVVLIDLPPAGTPEAVLMAESLPPTVAVLDAGTHRAVELRAQIHVHCLPPGGLVGLALNVTRSETF